jgi:hypothetical protein
LRPRTRREANMRATVMHAAGDVRIEEVSEQSGDR